MLFKDESLDAIELKSTWKKEKGKSDTGCQTKSYSITHRGIQATKRKEIGCQTEDFLYVEEQIDVEYDDSPELLAHLKRVAPLMCEQLERNANSRAFEILDSQRKEDEPGVCLEYKFFHDTFGEEEPKCVSAISWNCRGMIVGAAFGRFDHEDWCCHSSSVCLWRLLRSQRDPKAAPDGVVTVTKADIVMESNACVMCLDFHPSEPSLLAGGNFQGDLLIWDISRIDTQTGGDPLLANSNVITMRSDVAEDGDSGGHKESISKVLWLPSKSRGAPRDRLVTLGLDGKIFVWSLNRRKGQLALECGFRITAHDLPQSVRVKSKRDREVVLTTAMLCPDDPEMLLVGSDVGVIFKCSIFSSNANFDPALPMPSPVQLTFNPQFGAIMDLAFDAHQRNVVVSCGTQGCVQFNSILQTNPVATLDPGRGYLYGLSLSSVRQGLIAVSGASGDLLLYDLSTNSLSPTHVLSGDNCPVFAVSFNRSANQVAAGAERGCVRVWTLSDALASAVTVQSQEKVTGLVDAAAE